MKINNFVFALHQRLKTTGDCQLSRSHIYELLAASFGFNSYAAFRADAVFIELPQDAPRSFEVDQIRARCIELDCQDGMSDQIASLLPLLLEQQRIGAVSISSVIDYLRGEWQGLPQDSYAGSDEDLEFYDDGMYEEDEPGTENAWPALFSIEDEFEFEFSPMLLAELAAAAENGNPDGHYALALYYRLEPEEAREGAWWYAQAQQGKRLSQQAQEFADAYAELDVRRNKYEHHLRHAAGLGKQEALLDLAEDFGDPSFFELQSYDVEADPAYIASIAQNLGRVADAKYWLNRAAEDGDIEAMRELIEDYDSENLFRCWTWVYLSQLLDSDLTEDRYVAIGEDGAEYDDERGGPVYVGGSGGVELDALDAAQDSAARKAAQDLFARLQG